MGSVGSDPGEHSEEVKFHILFGSRPVIGVHQHVLVRDADHLHAHFLIESIDPERHAGNHFIKINHHIGTMLFDFLFHEKETLPENERARKITGHAQKDIGPFLLVERGEIGTVKLLDG